MTKLYLITGFLGSGKTTFLHKIVSLFPDRNIALVINEFGALGVDGALLQDLNIQVTEIKNGSIFCACKLEQFESAICHIMETSRSELIFVEASGLSDPSAVRSVFRSGAFPRLEYAGAICLVDGVRFHKIYQTARACRMQLAVSDLVLINKTDLAAREQIDTITAIALAQKPTRPVHQTAFGAFAPRWLAEMNRPEPAAGLVEGHIKDISLKKLTLSVSGFNRNSLETFLRMFAEETYRIKGFVELDGEVCVADCVGPLVEIYPFAGEPPETDKLVVLFGHGLPAKKSIQEAMTWFPDCRIAIL